MDHLLASTIGLLVAAIVVAQIARRLALPYTVGLVIAGIVLAALRINIGLPLTHDLIFEVILPPLLFEAALNIHWNELRRDLLPVLTLAVLGTVVSAAAVSAGMIYFLGWAVPSALVFGVLIAATDPVAVIATFKDNRIVGRMRLLVESESLFNDGVAAVLFALVLAWAQDADSANATDAIHVLRELLVTAGGGILVGLASGAVAIAVAGRISDHLVEATVTTVAAYGSFILAEHFHVSGVLATVVAGLSIGHIAQPGDGNRSGALTLRGREFVLALWEFIGFIANSVVFLLIGVSIAGIVLNQRSVEALLATIGIVLVGRALTVYPICLMFGRTRWAVPLREQHVLWWGGLRGALALALALALPATMEMRGEILIAAFGVVAFSVIAQGLTMPLLLRSLGFCPPTE